MEVLCCCDPNNLVGSAPEGLPIPIKEWIDQNGNTGFAYSAHGVNLEEVKGFEMAHKGKGKAKGKRRAWKEPKKRTWKK